MSDINDQELTEPSFTHVLPEKLQHAYYSVPPERMANPPEDLFPDPSPTLLALRRNLWKLINKAVFDTSVEITIKGITKDSGVARGVFYVKLEDADFCNWLFQSPMSEEQFLDTALETAQLKMLEILKFPLWKILKDKRGNPIMDDDGKIQRSPDISAARMIQSTFTMLDKRKHGDYTQKILQKSQLDISTTKIEEKPVLSIEKLEQQIAEIENDTKQITDQGTTSSED